MSIPLARWSIVLAAVVAISVAVPINACSSVDAPALRVELERLQAKQRPLEILQCMRQHTDDIPFLVSDLNANDRDVALYAIAQLGSDSIQSLGQQVFHNTAATWWNAYLVGVNPPYDLKRLNFAIRKLTQHARFSELSEFSNTLIDAIGKAGEQLHPDASLFLVDNLYRCPNWNVPASAGSTNVCTDHCRPLLMDFLKAMDVARKSKQGTRRHKDRSLANDLIKLEERLKC